MAITEQDFELLRGLANRAVNQLSELQASVKTLSGQVRGRGYIPGEAEARGMERVEYDDGTRPVPHNERFARDVLVSLEQHMQKMQRKLHDVDGRLFALEKKFETLDGMVQDHCNRIEDTRGKLAMLMTQVAQLTVGQNSAKRALESAS